MTTITARYPGVCANTGRPFPKGARVQFDPQTRQCTLPAGDLQTQSEPGRYISDVFRTSGGTFYRNKRGRCEDAPCCGCCTI